MDVSTRFSSLFTMNTSLSLSPYSVSAWSASPIFSGLSWLETDFLITKGDIGGRDLEQKISLAKCCGTWDPGYLGTFRKITKLRNIFANIQNDLEKI